MQRLVIGCAVLGLVVAVSAATGARAGESPIRFDNGLLPSIPGLQGGSAKALAALARPGLNPTSGIEIAPGVFVDRLIQPQCLYITNQNSGSNVSQTANIGSITLLCD